MNNPSIIKTVVALKLFIAVGSGSLAVGLEKDARWLDETLLAL
jgi:hypothetical protein